MKKHFSQCYSPVALLEQEPAALSAVLLVAPRLVQAVGGALPHLGVLGKNTAGRNNKVREKITFNLKKQTNKHLFPVSDKHRRTLSTIKIPICHAYFYLMFF